MEMLRKFYEEEDGLGTVEMVMLIAALMCIALVFKNSIKDFAENLMKKVFDDSTIDKPSGDSVIGGGK